jgi:hypothetical protein
MAINSHTVAMPSIPALLSHTATRRALIGARANDPVVLTDEDLSQIEGRN